MTVFFFQFDQYMCKKHGEWPQLQRYWLNLYTPTQKPCCHTAQCTCVAYFQHQRTLPIISIQTGCKHMANSAWIAFTIQTSLISSLKEVQQAHCLTAGAYELL